MALSSADIISSHTSREKARAAAKKVGGKVIKAGSFANGSFGLYAKRTERGQYVGGPNPLITVYHVVRR